MSTPESTPESTGPQSADRIRQSIWENRESPNGLPRNSRAEELVTAAEQSGDAELVRLALFNLIDAYEFSTERGKLIVPFARLLQEWDRDPSGFDQWDVQSLHWRFKWVGSGMLDLPEIPLDSIRQWQQEMGRRYAVAGYSPRAVRQSAYYLAYEIGDDEAADRHLAEWTAADRDQMSDCHACELNEQGGYWARRGEDDRALTTWAPVLDGQHVCAEEPHRVLAEALVPLVRLGRLDEARANHLRGYRMAKGNESLLRSIGHHLEFCALTGNEARGLEILGEHAAHLGPLNDADAQLGFGGGALVLLGRLKELGHGGLPAARYQGAERTVAELHGLLLVDLTALTARFDARNGTAASSTRLATRLGRRPLVDALPLGVRAVSVAAASVRPAGSVRPAASVRSVPDGRTDETVGELAVRARELRASGHPGATALWERIEVLSAQAGAAAPDPILAAELREHRALTLGRAGGEAVEDGTARRLFEEVVAAYRELGEPGRAAVNGVRIAVAAAQQGAPDEEIRAALGATAALVGEIPADDPLRLRRVATLDLTRIKLEAFVAQRAHAHRGGAEHDGGPDAEAGARFLAAMSGFVTEYGSVESGSVEDAGALADLVAEAEAALAHDAVNEQDWERAEALLTSAARRNQDAGRPWEAVEPLTRLAGLRLMLGRPDLAEEVSRTALECAADLTDAGELGTVRLTLAEALYQQDGKEAEAATYALEAAHWLDAAGEGAGAGAYARLVLAQAFGETGRAAEAAEILESALPDLLEHGDEQAVRARDTLGRLLRQLGDEKAAAEQYLLAAELAEDWDHPAPKARLAMLAGECLAAADGLQTQAERAYERAAELWREAGETFGHVRALRALAWLAAETRYDEGGGDGEDGEDGEDGGDLSGDVDRARALMDQALAALDEDGPEHRLERARTWSQLSQLLHNEDGLEAEAAELGMRAAEALREFGPEELPERASCVLRSAWAEQGRGREDEGRALLEAFVDELKALAEESDAAAELLKQVQQRAEHYG